MTLNITTLSTMGLFVILSTTTTCSECQSAIKLSVIILSVAFHLLYAECHYAGCRYTECRYGECRCATKYHFLGAKLLTAWQLKF